MPGPLCFNEVFELSGYVLADEPVDERDEGLAGARKNELLHLLVPIELEARGQRGDPDLPDRRVGRDDKLAARILEDNVEHAGLLLDLEAGLGLFFALDQVPLQLVECGLGRAPELQFILHGPSVASGWALFINLVRVLAALAGISGLFCRNLNLLFTFIAPFLRHAGEILGLGNGDGLASRAQDDSADPVA